MLNASIINEIDEKAEFIDIQLLSELEPLRCKVINGLNGVFTNIFVKFEEDKRYIVDVGNKEVQILDDNIKLEIKDIKGSCVARQNLLFFNKALVEVGNEVVITNHKFEPMKNKRIHVIRTAYKKALKIRFSDDYESLKGWGEGESPENREHILGEVDCPENLFPLILNTLNKRHIEGHDADEIKRIANTKL